MNSREEQPDVLLNHRIKAPEVRLLGLDKEMLGVMPTDEAQDMAEEAGVDLVMVSPEASPPVCRMMDYKKYKFDQDKKKKDDAKKQNQLQVDQKELKMRYNIDSNDYNVRLKAARKFLGKGDKVKVTCQFRGREADFKEMAIEMFMKFAKECEDVGNLNGRPQQSGRQLLMFIDPKDSKANLKAAADKEKRKQNKLTKKLANEEDEDSEDFIETTEFSEDEGSEDEVMSEARA